MYIRSMYVFFMFCIFVLLICSGLELLLSSSNILGFFGFYHLFGCRQWGKQPKQRFLDIRLLPTSSSSSGWGNKGLSKPAEAHNLPSMLWGHLLVENA